ncbi:MAG: DUF86 domain-containing protein [Bacteroidales bacterium]|nr:DUF86 domain-containing protein [Bacteroidales bacterium]
MRERARDKGRLQDIIEYSNNVTMLIDGYSFESLVSDKRTYYSVMKNVEIVGEAAYMLSKAFKDAHPETPWKIVQGMRHVLVHDYANVVSETLYDTAVNSIPELRKQVEKYLAETNWDEWEATEDTSIAKDDATNTEIARRMKNDGMDASLISKYTGLSVEEVEKI